MGGTGWPCFCSSSAVALISYLGTSYYYALQPGYHSFSYLVSGEVVQLANTSLPAFFLAAPFVFSRLTKSRRRVSSCLALFVVFMIFPVPAWGAFATSPVHFLPDDTFYLSTGTNAVEVRNFMQANLNGSPAYMLGIPYRSTLTPGVQDLRNLRVFSPRSQYLSPLTTSVRVNSTQICGQPWRYAWETALRLSRLSRATFSSLSNPRMRLPGSSPSQ